MPDALARLSTAYRLQPTELTSANAARIFIQAARSVPIPLQRHRCVGAR